MLSKSFKIVHISQQDPRYQTGGQGVTVENQCREQLFLGYEVYWISNLIKGFAEQEEILYDDKKLKIIRISLFDSDKIVTPYEGDETLQYKRRKEFGQKFVKLIKERFSPADTIVHLHGFYYVPLMSRELKEYNTCSQYHLFLSKRMESTGERDKAYNLIKKLEKESLKVSQKILAFSKAFEQEILTIYPQCQEKIFLMPNGIERRYLDPPFYSQHSVFRVVAYGRISSEKNFESIIKAINYCNPRINYLIFGKTDDTERQRAVYCQKLLKLSAKANNLKIIINHQAIRGEEKLKLIDSAHIVIIPSLYEVFGLVILEAMARGKPTIASLTAGSCEIMQTEKVGLNKFGYIVKKPEPQYIAEAINLFYQNPRLCQEISENCRKRAADFLWSKLIYRLMDIYEAPN